MPSVLTFKRLTPGIVTRGGQVCVGERDFRESLHLRVLVLGREADAHLGEEPLDRCRCRGAAEVLARHHLEVGELLPVLQPPVVDLLLALALVHRLLSLCLICGSARYSFSSSLVASGSSSLSLRVRVRKEGCRRDLAPLAVPRRTRLPCVTLQLLSAGRCPRLALQLLSPCPCSSC